MTTDQNRVLDYLRDNAHDLRSPARISLSVLIDEIAHAETIVAFDPPPATSFTILCGEDSLYRTPRVLSILVANDMQAEVIAGAKMILIQRRMTAPEIVRFGDLLFGTRH